MVLEEDGLSVPEFNFRYVGTEHRYNQLDGLLFMAGPTVRYTGGHASTFNTTMS